MRRAIVIGLGLLASCTVGPDYQRPAAIVPANYKEGGWKIGTPTDALDRGAWWSVFKDPVLDGLMREVDVSNQTLKAAEAAYREARAVLGQTRAAYYPTVSGTGGGTRSHQERIYQTQINVSAAASWDIDLWGKIRRAVEAQTATVEASDADLASARLSAQSQVAILYIDLRAADEQKRILDESAKAFAQSLEITRNQYKAGIAAAGDVAQALTQLQTTEAQGVGVGVQRAQFEHAIAVLVGKAPADFALVPAPLATSVPLTPPGIPSTLLERRPDIAAAERAMAAANAQIGVAEAAFYPDLTLQASYGFTSSAIDTLFKLANEVWSFGPQLSLIIFDGGLRNAQVEAARAEFDRTTANYRQTVLAGFQQVEDELASLRILEEQAEAEAKAVQSAREAERLILNQYKAGTVNYTSVITAQTVRLADEQTALAIQENRLIASVTLIEALGGGFDAAALNAQRK